MTTATTTCPHCKKTHSADDAFCPSCGRHYGPPPAAPKEAPAVADIDAQNWKLAYDKKARECDAATARAEQAQAEVARLKATTPAAKPGLPAVGEVIEWLTVDGRWVPTKCDRLFVAERRFITADGVSLNMEHDGTTWRRLAQNEKGEGR